MLLSAKSFALSDIEQETMQKNVKLAGFYLWLEALVISLTCVFLIFTFFFNTYSVDGESMLPTFNDMDRVFIFLPYLSPVQGDIVVFAEPNKITHEQKPLIKRIIAIEGQTVDIDFIKGIVYVDGKILEEDYVYEPIYKRGDSPMVFPVTIQPGKVFVLGDNRNNSRDSRNLSVGQIDVNYIRGVAVFKYWPTDKIGFLRHPDIY